MERSRRKLRPRESWQLSEVTRLDGSLARICTCPWLWVTCFCQIRKVTHRAIVNGAAEWAGTVRYEKFLEPKWAEEEVGST